jgi:hypothetical protein
MIYRNEAGQFIQFGSLVKLADGTRLTSGATVRWSKDGAWSDGAGTLSVDDADQWKYAPTTAETNCTRFAASVDHADAVQPLTTSGLTLQRPAVATFPFFSQIAFTVSQTEFAILGGGDNIADSWAGCTIVLSSIEGTVKAVRTVLSSSDAGGNVILIIDSDPGLLVDAGAAVELYPPGFASHDRAKLASNKAKLDTLHDTRLTAQRGANLDYLDAPVTSRLAPTVVGRALDVSATGEAGIDWANVGSPAAAVALNNTQIYKAAQVDYSVLAGAVNSINSDGITASSIADGSFTASKFAAGAFDAVWTSSLRTLTSFGTLTIDIWTYGSRTLTSLGSQFSGITSLANWLRAVARKANIDATTISEINASTGAGTGTYDATTDSQEAIRDQGDAAWITSSGGLVIPVNQVPVPLVRTWILKPSDEGLEGELPLVRTVGENQTFAVDFRNDLPNNGRLVSLDTATVVSGPENGIEISAVEEDRGVDRSQAKFKINLIAVGTYVIAVQVTYEASDGGGTSEGSVTLIVRPSLQT